MEFETLNEAIEQLQRLDTAISDGLQNEVAEALRREIRMTANKKVYGYQAEPYFMQHRRMSEGGLTDDENLVSKVEGKTLFMTNETPLQNLWGGTHTEPLTPVVEKGLKRYRQPYRRPFMNDARDNVVRLGHGVRALNQAFRRQGIKLTIE